MFCQVTYLRRCIPGRIRHALDELPETLDETYASTLRQIDEQNWEYARRLFQCVAAASRPLRVDELAEFLAFDFDAGSIDQLPHFCPTGVRKTRHTLCYPFALVCLPLSCRAMVCQLCNLHIFQSRST